MGMPNPAVLPVPVCRLPDEVLSPEERVYDQLLDGRRRGIAHVLEGVGDGRRDRDGPERHVARYRAGDDVQLLAPPGAACAVLAYSPIFRGGLGREASSTAAPTPLTRRTVVIGGRDLDCLALLPWTVGAWRTRLPTLRLVTPETGSVGAVCRRGGGRLTGRQSRLPEKP